MFENSNLVLPPYYGYVLLDLVGVFMEQMYFSVQVMRARRRYNVPYPNQFEQKTEGVSRFNCIQRAHMQFMETCIFFVPALLFAGLEHPREAAAFGLIFLIGRLVFFHGYASGDPQKRLRGAFYVIGVLGNLALCVRSALKHLA
ncbi:similar to microsomal glutathione S-transferase [Cyanidioschyzon merolae strain 10D]|jgi:glutathione S-transferase|uniref:Similar to microsomal glutathione S-transferase n=1 Tax=Cyanidioschyzon merolae (strain NIES-3377 / 10D) TaxID=280699 RepID=M1VM18_CYAM1|nr:similar to microsomal glutathione S-transferase [Cyanidioschyzon merolae strain 10D]BAM82898.1 similar to microsomal glutathione S-transferase [Cyanidioschyzon merolae strain 10D]|eukprot:XP_005538934.1 similar to microsomal glutathione S-transferase [Cyanidioschyzon merolae strain 10D]